jgi:hypothetical protein
VNAESASFPSIAWAISAAMIPQAIECSQNCAVLMNSLNAAELNRSTTPMFRTVCRMFSSPILRIALWTVSTRSPREYTEEFATLRILSAIAWSCLTALDTASTELCELAVSLRT